MGAHARHEDPNHKAPVTRRVVRVLVAVISADVVVDTLHLILAVLVAYGLVGKGHG